MGSSSQIPKPIYIKCGLGPCLEVGTLSDPTERHDLQICTANVDLMLSARTSQWYCIGTVCIGLHTTQGYTLIKLKQES